MANPNRKMATIRRVDEIVQIENADNIEAIRFGGWTVVANKGTFKPGDSAVYFEIDTFIPTSIPQLAFLSKRGTKKMAIDGVEYEGHVLRTAKLRGVLSQGLAMPITEFPAVMEYVNGKDEEKLAKEHHNVSDIIGVWEYYPPLPPGNSSIIGKYDTRIAPRTDAERIQNVSDDIWDAIKKCDYYANCKVDGTSMTMACDDGTIRVFSHNNELDTSEDGMGKISFETAKEAGIVDFVMSNQNITVQYELCGPKIQSDRLGLGKHRAFVFSAFDRESNKYVSPYEYPQLKDCVTPLIDFDASKHQTTHDAIEAINGLRGCVTKDRLDEGIVIHVIDCKGDKDAEHAIADALGQTMQLKIINNKYLLKG